MSGFASITTARLSPAVVTSARGAGCEGATGSEGFVDGTNEAAGFFSPSVVFGGGDDFDRAPFFASRFDSGAASLTAPPAESAASSGARLTTYLRRAEGSIAR